MPALEPASSLLPRRNLLSWHFFVLLVVACITLFARFFHPNTFGFFEDDFFYYVVAARNFALHGISSFDGTHLTNGYHPLWFLILAGLLRFTSGVTFLIAAQCIALIAIMAFYLSLCSLLTSLQVAATLQQLVALLLSLHALLLFRYGMEVTISLPLGVATLAWVLRPDFQWSRQQTILYGLLACLTVLGRLDSILVFLLLMSCQTLASQAPWPIRLRRIAWFALGFSPFLVYLGINHTTFGTLLPVSAAAKQMKPVLPPSLEPLVNLFLPLDRMKLVFVIPAVVLLMAGMVRLPFTWHRLTRDRRAVLVSLLLFPFLQNGLICLLSDWGTWPWYYYPLIYSSIASAVLLLRQAAARHVRPLRFVVVAAILIFVTYLSVYAVKKQPSPIALIAADLAAYMQQHPAVYAMGDEAGTTAYLSNQPVLQMEGLMMDRAFLANIREQRPLATVLGHYQARYYIVLYAQPTDGCYTPSEPSNGGPASPHMRGRICQPPIFTSTHGGSTASLFPVSAFQ